MGSRRRNLFILLFVVGLVIASLLVILSKETRLGLDLRGGTELVYEARPTPQNDQIDSEDVGRAIEIIRDRTDALGVSEPEIARVGEQGITVQLPDVQNAERAIAQVGTTAQLFLYDWAPNVIPNPDVPESTPADEAGYNRQIDAVRAASKQKPECFEDDCTTTGPRYYLFDSDSLEPLAGPEQKKTDLFLEFPGEEQPPNSEIIEVPQGTIVVSEPQVQDDPETETDEAATGPQEYFVLSDRPALSGFDITNPEQNYEQQGAQVPNVTFDFTDEGRPKFEEVTRAIAERGRAEAPPGVVSAEQASQYSDHFAIVLDNEVVTRPIINFVENPAGIDGRGGAQISGSFDLEEAQDLAEFLKIGALPIELQLISQSTVSATLGEEALDQGLKAGLAGLLIVLAFLIAYYRVLGVIAGLGLLVYSLFFYALIELIPITLTLPGIAGLILTIGVAADSNIVIFERIKEEARAGRSMASAIAEGYRKGIGTIIDANVITLITAFILFVLATSGVKGFAFTLGVGTIASLFTAVVFTQAVLGVFGRARWLRSPKLLGASTEQRVRWHFDFTGASRYFFSMSGVILAVGAIAFATEGLNLGIDFESGTRIKASLEEPATVDDVRAALGDAGVPNADTAEIQDVEDPDLGENVVQIQGELTPTEAAEIRPALVDSFGIAEGGDAFQETTIGPTFGEQVARSAVLAVVFSLLLIAGYMAIRFEAKYAVPVMIAVIHDLLITAGVYSIIGAEVSSGTVAAFLTILGYSLYDTVIVFDRVRENVPRLPRAAFSQIVNRSMSEVLTRSLITGLSTVFLIGVLLVFGGETLQSFALAMLVGVASGTYSSIFIASPVLTAWKEREPGYRARRRVIEEAMGRVPAFPEENVVAKLDEEAEREEGGEPGRSGTGFTDDSPRRPGPPEVIGAGDGRDGGNGAEADAEPRPAEPTPPTGAGEEASQEELVGAGQSEEERAKAARRAQRRARHQKRRRKHGRHR
ncbi:MAG TPA: protein translocase subunit SecD [Solirubrobacterales bacterium]